MLFRSGLFVYIIFTIFLINCSQKQKQYVPLIGLVQDTTTASNNTSNAITSSAGEVTLVAGGTKSDIVQTPEAATTSTPVVSITGSVGTISSSDSDSTTSSSTTSSSTSSSSSESTASSTESSSSNTSNELTSGTDTSSSSSSSNSTTTVTQNTTTETPSTTNTTTTSTENSTNNSLGTIQPSVTVTMGSTTSTLVAVAGYLLDSKENTIGGGTFILTGVSTDGHTLSIYSGTSTAEGAISGEFSVPTGVSNLNLVLSISGNSSQPVTIPVSVTTECKEDNNRGHGNDADGVDEDNTGNSTGVNSNGMSNRNENSFHDREGKCKLNSKTDYPKKAPRANTIYKQYYEVHFPGIYKDDESKEIYLDTNGFPWAISIPGVWAWQLESKDIRKTNETGYPKFNSWASSRGVNDKDWYTTVSLGKVYSLPSEPSRLMAYLKAGDSSANILKAIALIVFGSSIGLILRKKLISA